MGTPMWPERSRQRTKRARKFTTHDAARGQEEARWQCATCSGVIASNDDIYCIHCKMYWNEPPMEDY